MELHIPPVPENVQRVKASKRRGSHTIGCHIAPKCPITGKRRFRDKKQAHEALTHCQWQRAEATRTGQPTVRHERRVYQCPHCSGLHLTSRQQRNLPQSQPPHEPTRENGIG